MRRPGLVLTAALAAGTLALTLAAPATAAGHKPGPDRPPLVEQSDAQYHGYDVGIDATGTASGRDRLHPRVRVVVRSGRPAPGSAGRRRSARRSRSPAAGCRPR